MNRSRLDAAIQNIRDYTMKYAELKTAHHFLFDLSLNKQAGKPEVVVMGINPGETERDRQSYPGPTEETWNHDFHAETDSGRSRGSKNWRRNAEFFAGGRPLVFTELFFWSSSNQKESHERFGALWKSPHLSFCAGLNRILIEEYEPSFVVFVGVGACDKAAKIFGLQHVHVIRGGGGRLVEHYRDDSRPWFFTKHWSGAYGFSADQKQEIKNYIKSAV